MVSTRLASVAIPLQYVCCFSAHTALNLCRLYVSSPDQTLRYIAVISNGKSPGEIEVEDGMGNADFNNGLKQASYAYEVKELYELRDPLPLADMQRKYRTTFPQRFSYVTESMVKDIVVEDQIRLF